MYFTSKDGVFVFNELQQAFISKYSYNGHCDSIIGKYDTFIANKTESRDVNGIVNSYTGYINSLSGSNHTMFNKNIDFKLVYVVNSEPNIVKVFDNVRFGATEGMAK
nr:MAG TPA: stabilization protein [Caudoviricetes sp.]